MGAMKDRWNHTKEKVKETREYTNTREGSIFGFTVCMIIIVVLLLFLRFNNNHSTNNPTTTATPNPFQTPDVTSDVEKNKEEFKNILDANYEFSYTITTNGSTTTYIGKTYHNKESFTKVQNGVASAFYKLNDSYFNSNYATVENPYQYQEFMDIDNVLSLLDYASIEENTGSQVTANIYASDIYDIVYPESYYDPTSVITVPADTISFTVQDDQVTSIHYDLNNFITSSTSGAITSLTIYLTYSNFGTVEDFSIGS